MPSRIRIRNLKVCFRIHGVADVYAVRGLITALKIPKRRVVIKKIGREVDPKIILKFLTGFSFVQRPPPLKSALFVTFDTEGPIRLGSDGNPIVTYDPFKYFLPQRSFRRDRARLRRAIGLTEGQKIITVSCTGIDEARVVIGAFKQLRRMPRPLLILALRKPGGFFARSLSKDGDLQVHDRRSLGEPLSKLARTNVVILNTMGEFLRFVAASDLAIVGHDRNLFEPALCGVPALYFRRPLKMSLQEKKLAGWFKLFWRKNRTAKDLLDRFAAAKPIRLGSLHRQMEEVLEDPTPLIAGSQRAVQALYKKILPAARRKAASVFIRSVRLKNLARLTH